MIVGRVVPADAKSVIAGDQALDITAHRLLDAEAFDALRGAVAVEFIGVGRDVPCACRHFEKFALTSIRIEQSVSQCDRRDE